MQRDAETLGVGKAAEIAVAKNLHADESDGGRDAAAVLEQVIERFVARMREVHLNAVDQLLESGARQVELANERLQRNTLRSAGCSGIGGVELGAP